MHANFFFLLMSSRHAYLRSRIYGDFSHVFLRTKGSGSWLMISEDLGFLDLGSCFFRGPRVFWALAHVFKGPKVPDPGSCFQRPRIFGSWLMFSEDQGFFGLWLMFSEDQRF